MVSFDTFTVTSEGQAHTYTINQTQKFTLAVLLIQVFLFSGLV